MCIGMMKGGKVFHFENDETHAKFRLAEMRKFFLPKNKELCDEVVRRNYCANGTMKNSRVVL